MNASPQLNHIRKFAKLLEDNHITQSEFVNEFIDSVVEAPIKDVAECSALVPEASRLAICRYFHEFSELDYFDTRHMFDKRTHDHKRAMRAHYERVTQTLLTLLHCDPKSGV